MTLRSRDGGWAGLVSLLLALLIAGWLVRVALRHFATADATAAIPAVAQPAGALQRAKAVEGDVAQQAEDLRNRIGAGAK